MSTLAPGIAVSDLAGPRKTFSVESLLSGRIDVLSLLHYLHLKQHTGVRDLLTNMLYDLELVEIDSILPQLIHLWVQWDESQGQCLGDFFLAKCAQSQFLTLKIMWNLGAEEAHAPKASPQVARIQQMLKLAEMAHVNSEIPASAQNGGVVMRATSGGPVSTAPGSRAGSGSNTPARRSSTQELRQALKGSPGGTTLIAGPNASPEPVAAAAAAAKKTSPGSSAAPSTPNGKPAAAHAYPLVKGSSAPLVQVNITPTPADGGGGPNGPLVSTQIRACVNGSNGRPGSSPPAARPGSSNSSPTLRASPTPAGVIPPRRLSAGPARSPSLSSSPPAPHHYEPNDGLDPLQRAATRKAQQPQPQPHPSQRPAPPHPAARVSNLVPISLRSHPSSPAQIHSPLSGSLSSPAKSATPSMMRQAAADEDEEGDVFDGAAAAASVASVTAGSGALSPPDIDVDWPEADQDMIPRADASAAAAASVATITELAPQRKRSSTTGRPPAKYATMGGKRAGNGAGGGGVVAGSGSTGGPKDVTSPKDGFAMDDPTLFHLLSKQVRSEYFNLELLLFSTLHDLSAALTKVALHDRNRVLREQLRNIDDTIIRGLYFPMLPHSSLRHTHYRILRLLPEDCWTLASRDKAPFLLHCEISYVTSSPEAGRGHVCTFDNDIYTTYKSNAEIMREALALSGITAQAAGGFGGGSSPLLGHGSNAGGAGSGGSGGSGSTGAYPATPVTPSTGEASAAAQHTAAAIAAIAHAQGPLVVPPPPSVAPPVSVAPPTPIAGTNQNLDANPAANVQANGLNIVSDEQDARAHEDGNAALKASCQTAPNSASAAEDAASSLSKSQGSSSSGGGGSSLSLPATNHPLDSEGKPITRSRSSSQISSRKDSASSLEQARKTSASVSQAAAESDDVAATFHAQPDTAAWSVSAFASPRSAAERAAAAASAGPASTALAAAAAGAVAAPATPAAATASSAASSAASSVAGTPATTPSKPQRTVPPANPFKPRRASTYLTGPTLCDASFDTLSNAFGESFLAKKARVRASSPMAAAIMAQQPKSTAVAAASSAASSPAAAAAADAAIPAGHQDWDLISVIFKGGDDLRQEVLAMQFIRAFDRIFRAAKLPLYLNPYAVIITSGDSGLIETIPDAVSVDSLKKRLYPSWTCLTDFFAAYFGGAELQHIILGPEEFLKRYPQGLVTYQTALRNFVESVAAYSVVCWILQIKDRHNGNIMITRQGSVVHIDFGFMLSNSPGGNWAFEQAPFKLTSEYVAVMGGVGSDLFAYFRMLVTRGFLEARAHVDEFIVLCAIHAKTSHMPCFSGPTGATAIEAMRSRFAMHLTSEAEVEKFVDGLIDSSIDNWRSRKYDRFQKIVSGIL